MSGRKRPRGGTPPVRGGKPGPAAGGGGSTYERRDLSVTGIVIFLGATVLLILLSAVVSLGLRGTDDARVRALPWPGSRGEASAGAAPVLEVDPRAARLREEAAADSVLGGYGWSDWDSGYVRVPMARFFDLVAGDTTAGGGAP